MQYTEVFTEGAKFWGIDFVGHGQTRSVSLCVGSTKQSPIGRDLEKYTEVFPEDVKELLHRTRTVFLGVYLTDSNSDVLKA